MRECPACLRCYDDAISQCPDDGRPTFNSLPGDLALDGRYLVERRLGEGGMGVVYKAQHKFLKITRAVKVIKPELVGNDPSFATRFQQEAIAAAAIGHPNIISVSDYGFLGGEIPYLAMEFIEGKSLQDLMAAEGRFSPDKALEYMRVIASAVGAAHSHGIVHRDLKPLNIMLHSRGTPIEQIRILDFGLAKIKSGELFGSFVGAKTTGIIGSPYYMAPEQWSDEETDKRCDIYSLGIILYQMLSGDVPFKGTSIPAVMKKHLMTVPPRLSETTEGISPALEQVVLHALEKDPKLRTASCEELIAELGAAVAGSPTKGRVKGRTKTKTTTRARSTAAGRTTGQQLKPKPDEEVIVRSTADQQDALRVSQGNESSPVDDGTLLLTEQQSAELRGSQEVPRTSGAIEIAPDSAATIVQHHVSSQDLLAAEEPAPQIVSSGQRPLEVDTLQKAAEEARRRAAERAVREASGDLTSAARGASLPPQPPPVVKHVTLSIPPATDSGRADLGNGIGSRLQKPLVLGIGIAVLVSLIVLVTVIKFWPSSKVDTSVEAHNVPPAPTRDMAFIKGGSFNMGTENGFDSQKPVHLVSVVSFYLDKKEVTNAEYAAFVKATNHPVPALDENDPSARGGYWKPWNGTDPPAGWGNFPVGNVSAKDAEDYAEWLSKRDGVKYRLPTEAEWEYAARNGSTNSLFPWGNSWAEGRANLNGRSSPRDVGSFPEGATETGLLDMIGNVWEWTSSRASYYDQKKVNTDEVTAYVRRGGSFADKINRDFTNAADRTWYGDERYKFPTIGFRLARDPQ
jgi:serine/threonine protein kinase/formylglycine-generating enzyme required for sulfatase activity